MVGRSQAYQRNQYHNSRHSGAISLSMVCGRAVPYRVGSVADWHGVLLQGWFAGILARSLSIRVAVRCERRVVIVVERRARLSVGRFRRQIGTESCYRVGLYAYWHEAC